MSTETTAEQEKKLSVRKQDFFRYYAVRASAYFSKGSHDEWNIWQKLNVMRTAGDEKERYGMGSQIAGYFEGLQVDPGAAETPISAGYAVVPAAPVAPTVVTQIAPLTSAVTQLAQHQVKKNP